MFSVFCDRMMGRHTVEQKRAKRRNQKRRRRQKLQKNTQSLSEHKHGVNETSSCESDDVMAEEVHSPPIAGDTSTEQSGEQQTSSSEIGHEEGEVIDNGVHTPRQITYDQSDDELFAALDRIGEKSDEYWDVM